MFRCACRVCPAHPALLVTRRALRARHDNLRGSDARDGQVASRNRADFRNLMDVYLDAVFHPRAVEDEGWWVLRQEGWRYDAAAGDEDEDDDDGRARDLRGGAPLRGGPPPPGRTQHRADDLAGIDDGATAPRLPTAPPSSSRGSSTRR